MMQVFLGDIVTMMNGTMEDTPTFVTGQVKGIVLDDNKKVSMVYIHSLSDPLYMNEGWKFVDQEEYEDESDADDN